MSERPRPPTEQLVRYAEEFSNSTSLKFFGMKVSFPTPDRVRVELPEVRPEHLGGLGTDAVNGGVLAAMFDLVIGCSPALIDPTRRSATVQLSMTFMRPVRGKRIHAEAWVEGGGATSLFSRAVIYDEAGEVCARCDGVVKVSRHPWATGGSPAVN